MNRTLKFILGALCLLIVPTLAEFFNVGGWDWTLSDYAIVAVLLTALGASLAFATSPRVSMKQRVIGGILVLLVLATYVHLAVGIVDWLPLAGS